MRKAFTVIACLLSSFAAREAAGTEALPRLPPLAQVTAETDGTETWQRQGVISGSVSVARYDFAQAFMRQGWLLRERVPSARAGAEVSAWRKGEGEFLLQLTPDGPGKTRFALGKWAPPKTPRPDAGRVSQQLIAVKKNNASERIKDK